MKMALVAALAAGSIGLVAPAAAAEDEPCGVVPIGQPTSCPPPEPTPSPPPEPPATPTPAPDPQPRPNQDRPGRPIFAPAPQGVDHRPCVSRREFNGSKPGISRRDLEDRWEVSDLGAAYQVAGVGRAILYPRCGYDLTEASYGAAYRGGRMYGTVSVRESGSTLHGHI